MSDPLAPKPTPSPFDAFVQETINKDVENALPTMDAIAPISPDVMGQAVRTKDRLKTNATALALSQEPADLQAQDRRDQLREILRANPAMIEYIRDPEDAALIQDEIETIAQYEAYTDPNAGEFGTGLETGITSGKMAYEGVKAWASTEGVVLAETNLSSFEFIDNLPPSMPHQQKVQELVQFFGGTSTAGINPDAARYLNSTDPDERAGIRQQQIDSVITGEEDLIEISRMLAGYQAALPEGEEFSVDNFVNWTQSVAGQAVPMLVGAIAIGMVSGGTGAAAFGGTYALGSSYQETILEGGDIMDADFRDRAMFAAVVSGGLEVALGPVSRVVHSRLRGVPEGLLEEAAKGYLRTAGREITTNALEEGAQEVLQQALQNWAVDGSLEWTQEALVEYLQAFVGGAVVGGPVGGVVTAPSTIAANRRSDELAAADVQSQTIEGINKTVEETKLRDRAPSRFSRFLSQQGFNERSIFVDAPALAALAAERPAIVGTLGITQAQIDQAIQNGSSVPVNMAQYMINVPVRDPELATFIANNGRMTQEAMSAAEASEYQATEAKERAKEAAAAAVETGQQVTRQSQFIERVTEQLETAGQTRTTAQASGQLWGGIANSLATRFGDDKVFDMLGVDIRGPAGQRAAATGTSRQYSQTQAAEPDIAQNTIVDARGEPVRMYHGTNQQSGQFDGNRIFMANQSGLASQHALRNGYEGARVVEGTVAMENPLERKIVGEPDAYYLQNSEELEAALEGGIYDGIMLYNEAGDLMVIATNNDQVTQRERQTGDVRQFRQSEIDRATADVEAAADLDTQQADVIARIESAGGEVLEFNQIDGLVSSDKIPVLTAKDMVGMKIFPTVADRTAAAALYTGIDGTELDVAVPLLGGPMFPLRVSNFENNVVWANRGASVTSAKEGKLAAGATHMLVTLGDQNMHISNTTVNYAYLQTFFAKMQSDTPPDAAGITKWLRNWQKDAAGGSAKTKAIRKDINAFPSFDDRQALIDYTHKISFDARKQLMKLFSTADIQGMGGPNVQAILDATREQSLAGMNWGDGVLLVELDRGQGGGSFTRLGDEGTSPHPDFPLGIRGRVAGKLETPLGWKTLWQDWVAENSDKENPRRAFELSRPVVEVTEELSAKLESASSVGVQTPLHAKLVARLIDGDLKRTGVAKNKGGIGPADYFNEANVAAAGGGTGPIRATLKDLNAGIKSGDVKLAQVGEARVFSAVEGNRITHIVNNESGTEGLGETVAILDAIRSGATEVLAPVDSFLYNLAEDLGFVPTDETGVLRLEGDTNGYVERYLEQGPAGLLEGRNGGAGRSAWTDGPDGSGQLDRADAGAELAATAATPPADGADTLASRAGRVASVLKGLKPEALANLGLNEQDAATLQGGDRTLAQSPVDTPAFQRWFGDSKVVDENGDPLVVYHGTDADIEEFSAGQRGKATGAPDAREAFFFAASSDVANSYAANYNLYDDVAVIRQLNKVTKGMYQRLNEGILKMLGMRSMAPKGGENVVPVFLSLQNPMVVDLKGEGYDSDVFMQAIEQAKSEDRDGVIFRNSVDTGFTGEAGATDIYAVFNPTDIKSQFNVGTFDPADPRILNQDARGLITIPTEGVLDGTAIIDLMKNSDLSTFLHESGHFFLEAFQGLATMAEAPQGMREDLIKINEWMGREASDTSTYTTEQQEMWAETFETYLMQGTAPTPTLKAAFARFARWLSYIYKGAKLSRADLTPEIRDVMDRLVATDEELATAREYADAKPLFKETGDMNEQDFETYQRSAERSDASAQGKALEAMMVKIRRQRTKEYKKRLEQVKLEVADEVAVRREYVMIAALGGRDEDFGDGARLNKAAMVEMFGPAILDDLKSSQHGTKKNLYMDGGSDPDLVAESFGYRNASAMVNAIRSTPPIEKTIDKEARETVDREMLSDMTEPAIKAEAEAAINNPARNELVAREISQLQRQAGGKPTRWQVLNRIAADKAERALETMVVRDIMNYRQYLRASQKASREAQRQFAKVVSTAERQTGKSLAALKAAAVAKQQQLEADHLYRAAREQARKIESFRKRTQRLKKTTTQKAIGPDYMDAVDTILDKYDMRVLGPKEAKKTADLAGFHAAMMQNALSASVAFDPSTILSTTPRHYSTIEGAELMAVMDTVDNIIHMGREATSIDTERGKMELADVLGEIEVLVGDNIRGKAVERSLGSRGGFNTENIRHTLMNPDALIDEIDHGGVGAGKLGTLYNAVKLPIDRALDRLDQRRQTAATDMNNLFAILGGSKGISKLSRDHKVYPQLNGDKLSTMDLIMFALNLGNAGNAQRIEYDINALQGVLNSTLTEQQWRFVQDTWDYLDSFWPEINETHRKLTGLRTGKVKHEMMISGAPEFVTGGYFPIRYDKELSNSAENIDRASLLLEGKAGSFLKAQTPAGHKKARLDKVNNKKILLDPSIISNHVFNVLHDLELGEPVQNAGKIIYNDKFKEILNTKKRGNDSIYMKSWLEDIAIGEHRLMAHTGAKFIRWMRGSVSAQAMGFNMSTAVIQLTGVVNSLVEVGPKHMMRGYGHMFKPEARERVYEASPFMVERIRTFNTDMSELTGLNSDLGVPQSTFGRTLTKTQQTLLPWAFMAIQYTQFYAADLPTWLGAYDQAVTGGQSPAAAVAFADKTVRSTQGSGRIGDRSNIERGRLGNADPNAAITMATFLYSFMNMKLNRAYLASRGMGKAYQAQHYKVLGAQMAAAMWILYADEIAYTFIKEGMPDEEDDETWGGMYSKTLFAPVSLFPVGREAMSYFRFGDIQGPFSSSVGGVSEALVAGRDLLVEGKDPAGNAADMAEGAAIALGLPMSQLIKLMEDTFDPSLGDDERLEKISRRLFGEIVYETLENL